MAKDKKVKKTSKVRPPRRTVRDLVPGYDKLEGEVKDIHGWLSTLTPQEYAAALKEVETLERIHGGISTGVLVAHAQKQSSVLHKCFTWDDSIAAAFYRNSEARRVLRGFVFVPTQQDLDMEIPYFVNVRTSEPKRGVRGGIDIGTRDDAYVVIKTVVEHQYMMRDMVDRGMRRLLTFRSKFGHLARFVEVVNVIDKLKTELDKERAEDAKS
jgi:hypothetical protein